MSEQKSIGPVNKGDEKTASQLVEVAASLNGADEAMYRIKRARADLTVVPAHA